MLYPVHVYAGNDQYAHSVTIPDCPGCFSAADEWDDLPARIQEAAELHIDGEEMDVPEPSSIVKRCWRLSNPASMRAASGC